jgi:DNA-directed RNA polymerase specialized sigma24 family protein
MSAILDGGRGELPGDADAAMRQLYAGHASALRGYVERFCPDRTSAEDIVQETFIRAWRHLPQLTADDRPATLCMPCASSWKTTTRRRPDGQPPGQVTGVLAGTEGRQ